MWRHVYEAFKLLCTSILVIPVIASILHLFLIIVTGFNDLGEMIPFQGGTNEENVSKMYKQLNEKGKAQNLSIYWYTGKDQVKPMNAAEKKRNCHGALIENTLRIASNGLDSEILYR